MTARISEPRAGLSGLSGLFWTVGVFSFAVNMLVLTAPLYMLQVYDRVIPGRSRETLVALTILAASLYAIMGVLEHVRSRLVARIGATVQARLDGRVFLATLSQAMLPNERSRPASGLRDLEAVQKLAGSPVLFAVFDIPWAPLMIAAIYGFHPLLGHLAVAGGLVLVCITALNQITIRGPEAEAAAAAMHGEAFAETIRQQSEMIQALGMRGAALDRWQGFRRRALTAQLTAGDRVSRFAQFSKAFRYFLQSAMLGLGAYVVLEGEMSAGAMIAGSILLGRALAPVEQAIAGWPLVLRARQGWTSLKALLASTPEGAEPTTLPRPHARLEVSQATAFPPGERKATLRMLDFRLEPGQALGVIGASASGKSTLARILTGIWAPAGGSVRLDGAALDHFAPDVLGGYIGYLPQDVVLFEGTIAENIGRMLPHPDPVQVVAAARKAGAHEMVLRLPQGYDTRVAAGGARLSGGQKQRIGLARAFYGDPLMLVLDEPNSNLDADGQDALNIAIRQAKTESRIVIVMAHRPAGIAECDLILIIDGGAAKAFGPRDEVLKAHVRNYAQVAERIPQEVQG